MTKNSKIEFEQNEYFAKAMSAYANRDIRKFNRLRKNPTLSSADKKVLEARLYIYKQNFKAAVNILNKAISEDLYTNSEKYFSLGYCYTRLSRHEDAILSYNESLGYNKMLKEKARVFATYKNLFNSYKSLGLDTLAKKYLKECKKYITNKANECSYYRTMALTVNFKERTRSETYINKALGLCKDVPLSMQQMTKHAAFTIFFNNGKLDKAKEFLAELKKMRAYLNYAAVLLDEKLMDILEGKALTLGAKNPDIKASKEINLKWELIRALLDGNKEKLSFEWGKLCKLYPHKYKKDFEFGEIESLESSLFYKCFNYLYKEAKLTELPDFEFPTNTKLNVLYRELKNAKMPLKKEYLIEKIWAVSYSPDFDNKFYRLVNRLKKEIPYRIVNVNYAYKLVKA